MRVLGIDVGLKRTGLALSDETGTAVRLLPNLHANSRQAALEKLLSLISEFAVEVVIIGKPDPNTTGSIAIAKRADGLKEALDEQLAQCGMKVTTHLCNEANTSKRGMESLVSANVPQKKRLQLLDAASAAILVEDFLRTLAPKTDAQ